MGKKKKKKQTETSTTQSVQEQSIQSNVIIVPDGTDTISTDVFPYASFPYPTFNPPQTSILPYIEQDVNLVISIPTSAGKTLIAEMCIAYEWYENERTGIYVGPMKALVQEKIDDWTNPNHHFSFLDLAICSGDYQITAKRIDELNNAHVISITPEMLAVRCRHAKSEKSQFINNAGVCVWDESHIITCLGRGDAVEIALMDMAKINPKARIVFLSATMANGIEVCEWLTSLNGKKTAILESTYRPIPLVVNYVPYAKPKWNKEKKKIDTKTSIAIDLVKKHPEDKFLVFYHTKVEGWPALKTFKDAGIETVFFNADQKKEDRIEYVRRFLDQDDLRVMLTTSSMAWGVNTPAKHVIIMGPYRGNQQVEVYDIMQMRGRAGRPQYETEGFVHHLIPETEMEEWIDRYSQGCIIDSTFANCRRRPGEDPSDHFKRMFNQESWVENIIAHHLIAQIDNGSQTKELLDEWFKRTLAYFQQGDKALEKVDKIINALGRAQLVKKVDGEKRIVSTKLGQIASMMYYAPFDVAGFHKNIKNVKDPTMLRDEDVAYILANVNSNYRGWFSEKEQEAVGWNIVKKGASAPYHLHEDGHLKAFCAWYQILRGEVDGILGPMQGQLMQDAERIIAILKMIDKYYHHNMDKQLDVLATRCKYGVLPHLAQLCLIPGIGRVRAQRLYENRIRTPSDLISMHPQAFKDLLGIVSRDVIDNMIKEAIHLKHTT